MGSNNLNLSNCNNNTSNNNTSSGINISPSTTTINNSNNSSSLSGMNNTSNNSSSGNISNINNSSNMHADGPLGSVYWFAPEVAQGVSHSFASDIWALGCVALELLTGHPPFFHRPTINALYTIAHCTEPPLPLTQ